MKGILSKLSPLPRGVFKISCSTLAFAHHQVPGKNTSATEAAAGEDAGSAPAQPPAPPTKYIRWLKTKGTEAAKLGKDQMPSGPENEVRSRQLQHYCGGLLEQNEDDIIEYLRSGKLHAENTGTLLCGGDITSACPKRSEKGSGAGTKEEEEGASLDDTLDSSKEDSSSGDSVDAGAVGDKGQQHADISASAAAGVGSHSVDEL